MNRWLTDVEIGLSGVLCDCNFRSARSRLFIDALLAIKNLLLEEFEVLAENLNRKAIQVYCLSASFINAVGLLLDFFVFENYILLDGKHFVAEALNRH